MRSCMVMSIYMTNRHSTYSRSEDDVLLFSQRGESPLELRLHHSELQNMPIVGHISTKNTKWYPMIDVIIDQRDWLTITNSFNDNINTCSCAMLSWWRKSCNINIIIIGYSWSINEPPLINALHIVHDGGTMASAHGFIFKNFCQLFSGFVDVLPPFCHKLCLTWRGIFINDE